MCMLVYMKRANLSQLNVYRLLRIVISTTNRTSSLLQTEHLVYNREAQGKQWKVILRRTHLFYNTKLTSKCT